jgi:hypothetical protein
MGSYRLHKKTDASATLPPPLVRFSGIFRTASQTPGITLLFTACHSEAAVGQGQHGAGEEGGADPKEQAACDGAEHLPAGQAVQGARFRLFPVTFGYIYSKTTAPGGSRTSGSRCCAACSVLRAACGVRRAASCAAPRLGFYPKP